MNQDFILELRNVSSAYGKIAVLKDICMHVNKGEVVTIIGANGAGKTTTLMAISAIQKLTHGEILYNGESTHADQPHTLVAKGLAHVPEGRKIFPRLTVLENLKLGAYTREKTVSLDEDFNEVFELFPVLKERQHQFGGTLSGGEQQMLAIARALMCKPKLLLLDEPSMGIAPILVAKIFETLKELNRRGLTLLLVEQNAHLALKLANRGYVLETGRMVIEARADLLLNDARVKEAYLGEDTSPRSENAPE